MNIFNLTELSPQTSAGTFCATCALGETSASKYYMMKRATNHILIVICHRNTLLQCGFSTLSRCFVMYFTTTAWAVGSCSFSPSAEGTFQNVIYETLWQSGKNALYKLLSIPRYYHPKNASGHDFKSPSRGQVDHIVCEGSASPNGPSEANGENGQKIIQVWLKMTMKEDLGYEDSEENCVTFCNPYYLTDRYGIRDASPWSQGLLESFYVSSTYNFLFDWLHSSCSMYGPPAVGTSTKAFQQTLRLNYWHTLYSVELQDNMSL